MKKLLTLLFLIITPSLIFGKEIILSFHISDNSIYEVTFDDSKTLLSLSNTNLSFLDETSNLQIIKVDGFEQFKNLQILEIKDIYNISNFSFLLDLPQLRELYIKSCLIESLDFLQYLVNLEILYISVYVSEENAKKMKTTKQDLSELLFLKRIDFRATILTNDDELSTFNGMPLFYNVQNQPVINLGNNGITELNNNERLLLKQYSIIYLYPNPILNDDFQMECLRDLNVVTK